MDIRKLPRHPKSGTWKRATHAGSTRLHPDFGPPSYGIPFDVVPSSHEKVAIDFHYDDESDPGPYPFGDDVQIEGGSDRHAIMIDEGVRFSGRCTMLDESQAEESLATRGGTPRST